MSDLSRENNLVLRDETGVLRESITGARVMIFSCSAYRSMCDALFDQFQSGAGIILYRMGEGYGRKLIQALPKLGMSADDMMQGLKSLGFLAGWGKFQLEVTAPENVSCFVEQCAFLLRREGAGPNTCYFLSGILGALGGEIYKKKFVAKEIKCASSGYKNCEFRAFPDTKN
ncbi:MAG: hypothetical protein OK439_03470 [Thaumarchaeota archaeon]|nr:hypothetical protein [Nitrososphaerota archaeon]